MFSQSLMNLEGPGKHKLIELCLLAVTCPSQFYIQDSSTPVTMIQKISAVDAFDASYTLVRAGTYYFASSVSINCSTCESVPCSELQIILNTAACSVPATSHSSDSNHASG